MVLKALIDTGNCLYEPLTGKPVSIVEYDRVKNHMDGVEKLQNMWLIPFRTMGMDQGVLWAMTADQIIFEKDHRKMIKSGCIIALYLGKIDISGEFHAILHPKIIKS